VSLECGVTLTLSDDVRPAFLTLYTHWLLYKPPTYLGEFCSFMWFSQWKAIAFVKCYMIGLFNGECECWLCGRNLSSWNDLTDFVLEDLRD